MKKNIVKFFVPLSLFFIGSIVWFMAHWRILSQEYIFCHDSLNWFGAFHYLAESLQNGFFPFWNPYLHGGEMFFENFTQMSLIDPIMLIGIYVGKWVGIKDLLYLYELIVLSKIIILAVGVQLFFNEIVPSIKKWSYFTFFILLLSSFSINCYHQNGAYLVFGYVPFILLFLIKFFKSQSWLNAILLGYFIGISFQSIVFAYVATFLFIFLCVYLVFNKGYLKIIFQNKLKIFVAMAIFICLSSPAWILLFYKDNIFPYARFLFNSQQHAGILFSNYEAVGRSLAPFGKWGDILTLGILPLAGVIYSEKNKFLKDLLTELSMYVGLIPFLLGVFGIFFSKHKYKLMFLILLFVIGCLFLGALPYNFVYRLLFFIIFPLRTIENSHEFVNYFLFCYVFFICIGIEALFNRLQKSRFNKYASGIIIALFIVVLAEFSIYCQYIYDKEGNFRNLASMKKRSVLSLNFDVNADYELNKRVKTVMYSYVNNEPITVGAKENFVDSANLYFFNCHDPDYRLNFRALIEKKPGAIDFCANFPYGYLRIISPTALTYPKLYVNILKSDISQELKATLLGVGLLPIEFYTNYSIFPQESVLNKEMEQEIRNILSGSVILSGGTMPVLPQQKQLTPPLIEILEYKPQRIKLQVSNDSDGVLLFRDGYHPDWIARVNSMRQKIFRANYNSKAVFLRKGGNIVEFVFRPVAYMVSLCVYAILSALIVFYLLAAFFRNRFFKCNE